MSQNHLEYILYRNYKCIDPVSNIEAISVLCIYLTEFRNNCCMFITVAMIGCCLLLHDKIKTK
jgi:hypothetical protein